MSSNNIFLSAIKKRRFDTIPPLITLAIDTLRENLDSLESIDGIPSELALRILETATAEQLDKVEHFTGRPLPYLDVLWKKHYINLMGQKAGNEIQPTKGTSWRKLYKLKKSENDEKVKRMGERLKNSYFDLAQQKIDKQTVVLDKTPPSAIRKVNKPPQGSSYYSNSTHKKTSGGGSSSSSTSKLDKLRKEHTKQTAHLLSPPKKVGSGLGVIVPPKDIKPGLKTSFAVSKKPKTY